MERDQFITIIQENQSLIYKICKSYCSDPEYRKDLEQEICIQLWNSFKKFDGRVKISTWIYRIALNTAITFYRKEKKHKDNVTSIDSHTPHTPPLIYLEEDDPEQDSRIKKLYEFIDQENELNKALILLYLDDIKYSEIATIVGISETNVATKISRIKKKLKEQFNSTKDQ